MTSGLFNTGGTGGSAEFTSITPPPPSDACSTSDHYGTDLDLSMLGDLGDVFDDPLGDASLDSFTDLSALLSGHSFLDPGAEQTQVTLFDLGGEVMPDDDDLKPTYAALNSAAELPKVKVVDHDYSAKRPRVSEPADQSVEDVFLPPTTPLSPAPTAPSPAPSVAASPAHSTASGSGTEDKYRLRREKNNVASKRSRETRKRKFVDMEAECEQLVVENARLEARITKLEDLAKRMQKILVAKMAGK